MYASTQYINISTDLELIMYHLISSLCGLLNPPNGTF